MLNDRIYERAVLTKISTYNIKILFQLKLLNTVDSIKSIKYNRLNFLMLANQTTIHDEFALSFINNYKQFSFLEKLIE